MVRKIINKVTSVVTTTLLAFTTLAAAIPVTTYAASATVRSKHELTKQSDPVGTGYSTFDFDSKVSGVEITHSKNLKKAVKTGANKDWIWQDRDEGGDSANNKARLRNAWIAPLESGKSYWMKYSGVAKEGTTKKYDVKVVFDNPVGSISGAEGHDIAIFDGQLGAVRFRGYKHIDCTIYVYEHGTSNLVYGNDNKLHFRFIDIDCNQAVEALTPGRVDWWYIKSKVEWTTKSKCTKIGATQGNTFGAINKATADDDAIQIKKDDPKTTPAQIQAYNSAVRHTAALGFTPQQNLSTTFKVRYYAGGTA